MSTDSLPSLSSLTPSLLDRTIGALLVGSFLSTILYGLGLHQVYRYARLYPKDTPFIRILVITVFTLETLQVVFSMHACYHTLVTNYFNPVALFQLYWTENLITVTGCLIIISSEMFFIRRVSLISCRYKVIAWLAAAFLVVKLAGDIALSAKGFSSNSAFQTYTNNSRMIAPPLVAVTAANALMTGSLVACLRKSRENYTGRDSLLDVATLYVVNTGLLILIADIIMLILAVARMNDLYWVTMHLIAARLYMNTLLCVLNSRKMLITRGVHIFDAGSFGTNIIARANRLAAAETWNVPQVPENEPPSMVDIKVTTEVEGDACTVASPAPSKSRRESRKLQMPLVPQRYHDFHGV
ncbi:hypothetical protein C8Q80DRAFT_659906 [Daedaleopsis nitida]|nr:hypothetical protein C8Q80DRAFT_659906 [Daedaleopsis nitida]